MYQVRPPQQTTSDLTPGDHTPLTSEYEVLSSALSDNGLAGFGLVTAGRDDGANAFDRDVLLNVVDEVRMARAAMRGDVDRMSDMSLDRDLSAIVAAFSGTGVVSGLEDDRRTEGRVAGAGQVPRTPPWPGVLGRIVGGRGEVDHADDHEVRNAASSSQTENIITRADQTGESAGSTFQPRVPGDREDHDDVLGDRPGPMQEGGPDDQGAANNDPSLVERPDVQFALQRLSNIAYLTENRSNLSPPGNHSIRRPHDDMTAAATGPFSIRRPHDDFLGDAPALFPVSPSRVGPRPLPAARSAAGGELDDEVSNQEESSWRIGGHVGRETRRSALLTWELRRALQRRLADLEQVELEPGKFYKTPRREVEPFVGVPVDDAELRKKIFRFLVVLIVLWLCSGFDFLERLLFEDEPLHEALLFTVFALSLVGTGYVGARDRDRPLLFCFYSCHCVIFVIVLVTALHLLSHIWGAWDSESVAMLKECRVLSDADRAGPPLCFGGSTSSTSSAATETSGEQEVGDSASKRRTGCRSGDGTEISTRGEECDILERRHSSRVRRFCLLLPQGVLFAVAGYHGQLLFKALERRVAGRRGIRDTPEQYWRRRGLSLGEEGEA